MEPDLDIADLVVNVAIYGLITDEIQITRFQLGLFHQKKGLILPKNNLRGSEFVRS